MYKAWCKHDGAARHFGVEMEVSRTNRNSQPLSGEAIKEAMRNARVPRLNRRAPGYYHSDGTSWDVKTDASCGWEIASPKLALDDNLECDQLQRACTALQACGASVNASCGLHVHIDLSDFDWRDMQRLVALWARYEPFFFELAPQDRRRNQYCPPIRKSDWAGSNHGNWTTTQRLLAVTNERDFRATLTAAPRGSINLHHFVRNGRVEFRLQAGTTNYLKIKHWVIILLALVNRAKHPVAPPVSLVINQPYAIGFGTRYVFQVLGLAPNSWAPQVPPVCAAIETWAENRRRLFARP